MRNLPYIPYEVEQPWLPFSEVLLDWDNDFHQLMLHDSIRMVAYEKAIKKTVKPGDVVLDLGTGTGILSIWALEAGAKKVYGIDLDSNVLNRAIQLIDKKGFSDKFVAINKISFDTVLPEQVDVLISEIIGNIADNEDFQPILSDAIDRFLKPNGKCIPENTQSYLVPITAEQARIYIELNRISTINNNYNLSNLLSDKNLRNPFNLYYDTILPYSSYLGEPTQIRYYYGKWNQTPEYDESRIFTVNKKGLLSGFKGYFSAKLCDGVTLDISGDNIGDRKCSDSWKHSFFPLETPIYVNNGDQIDLKFSRTYPKHKKSQQPISKTLNTGNFKQLYHWRGKIIPIKGPTIAFHQSMSN